MGSGVAYATGYASLSCLAAPYVVIDASVGGVGSTGGSSFDAVAPVPAAGRVGLRIFVAGGSGGRSAGGDICPTHSHVRAEAMAVEMLM